MGNDNNIMKPVRYTKPAIPHYLYRHKSAEANQEVTETETEMTHVGSDTSDDTNFHYDSKSDNDFDEYGTSENEYDDVDYIEDEEVSDFESD